MKTTQNGIFWALNGHLRITGYYLRGDQSSTPDRHLEGKHGCRHTVLGGPAEYRSVVRAATDLFFQNAARLPWARTIRLQQLHQLLSLLCVFSNLGNLLFAQS